MSIQICPASDVYAIGAVLYSLTTGRPPFQAASSLDTLRQVIHQGAVRTRQINPGIPRDLETIILKCLDKSLTRRYNSAQQLADELRRFIEGRPILARPISRTAKTWRWCQRQPVVASLLSAVLLTMAVGIGVSSYFAWSASIAAAEAIRSKNKETIARKHAVASELRAIQAARRAELARVEEAKQAEYAKKQADIAQQETAKAEEARAAEAHQTKLAKDKSRELRRSLYLSDMRQLAALKAEGKIPRIRELLQRQIPLNDDEEDLRSFDWHYWNGR